MSEAELSQCVEGQVCDYLLAMEDVIVLIECKSTSYSSTFVTENAVRGDNSTAKIVEGFRQVSSVAGQLQHPRLLSRIGEVGNRAVVGVVVTFKHIRLTHSPLYCTIVDPQVEFAQVFTWRPQVIDIRALQMLILSACGGHRLSSLFQLKLDSDLNRPSEWDNYLIDVVTDLQAKGKDPVLPLLEDAWRSFLQEADNGDSAKR